MIFSIDFHTPIDDVNFDEAAYLEANPDVANAVACGDFPSGRAHFNEFGKTENRRQLNKDSVERLRDHKMGLLAPRFRTDMEMQWRGNKADFLTAELREQMRIIPTENVSSNGYDGNGLYLIEKYRDGLVLDCGAGSRGTYYRNVVNYEIADYPSTDVLGVGEELPFMDDTFDAAISIAVLEHVRNPFKCAREISRVLKPGGELYCCVPFLQPYHGYPHHYFNATAQGIRRLFEDELKVESVDVIDSIHPIFALTWIVQSWLRGLVGNTREDFLNLTLQDLTQTPDHLVTRPFCQELTTEKKLELASATILKATKG